MPLIASTTRRVVEKSVRMQIEPDDVALAKGDGHCALDRCAACNTARAQMIDLHLASARRGAESAHQQIALRHRVDLPVGALKRGHQQCPASQAPGIAHA